MEIRSVIEDDESEEVKFDFRVISWALNESGSFLCNRNNNPPVLTTAPEDAGRVEDGVRVITFAETEGEQQ